MKGKFNVKRKWVAKVDEKDRIYALYPSVSRASVENLLTIASMRNCIKDYVPDDNGFYYRLCESVNVDLTPLEFWQILE